MQLYKLSMLLVVLLLVINGQKQILVLQLAQNNTKTMVMVLRLLSMMIYQLVITTMNQIKQTQVEMLQMKLHQCRSLTQWVARL